ncbi:MAG: Crp/Fnr family transcriptional regulator [Candidatus Anammoxibacter sp.]
MLLNILKQIPFFSGMNNDDLVKIKKVVIERKFKKQTTIFSENEEAKGFYFVISGRVKIFKLSPEGKEHVLHICVPGDMFAEAAMFSGNIYPAYAATITDSSLLFIQKKGFLRLIMENPDISIKMLGALSIKLRKFSSMIEDLSLKEVPARLAKYLLDISVHTGNKTFTLGIKKTDLALKLGTAGETLSRTLKKFKDKHIITSTGNKICLTDIESLKEISAGMKI